MVYCIISINVVYKRASLLSCAMSRSHINCAPAKVKQICYLYGVRGQWVCVKAYSHYDSYWLVSVGTMSCLGPSLWHSNTKLTWYSEVFPRQNNVSYSKKFSSSMMHWYGEILAPCLIKWVYVIHITLRAGITWEIDLWLFWHKNFYVWHYTQ